MFAVVAAASVADGRVSVHARPRVRARRARRAADAAACRFALLAAGTFATSPLAFLSCRRAARGGAHVRGLLVDGPRSRSRAHASPAPCSGGSFPAERPLPVLRGRTRRGARRSAARDRLHLARPAAPACSSRSSRSYAAACLLAYMVPSPIGENIARLRYVAIPVAAADALAPPLAPARAGARRVRPRALVERGAARDSVARAASDPSAERGYWTPAVRFLRRQLSPSYRVEAVDTAGHWEAVYLAEAGHPDRPRLVPPGRLPAERAALRPARPPRLPALAAQDGRPLRRAHDRAARLQRTRRGAAPPQRRTRASSSSSAPRRARSTPCPHPGRSSPGPARARVVALRTAASPSACPVPAGTASRFATRRTGPAKTSASDRPRTACSTSKPFAQGSSVSTSPSRLTPHSQRSLAASASAGPGPDRASHASREFPNRGQRRVFDPYRTLRTKELRARGRDLFVTVGARADAVRRAGPDGSERQRPGQAHPHRSPGRPRAAHGRHRMRATTPRSAIPTQTSGQVATRTARENIGRHSRARPYRGGSQAVGRSAYLQVECGAHAERGGIGGMPETSRDA